VTINAITNRACVCGETPPNSGPSSGAVGRLLRVRVLPALDVRSAGWRTRIRSRRGRRGFSTASLCSWAEELEALGSQFVCFCLSELSVNGSTGT